MPRPLIALVGLVLAVVLLAAPAPAGAAARAGGSGQAVHAARAVEAPPQQPDAPADDGTGGSADDEPDENPPPGAAEQDIIPRPNSGHEPTEAGDRGGALQILVFVAIVAGLGVIGALAVRDVRRSRARATGTGAEPVAPTDPH
jgi:uncharacterized membrane protein